MPRGNVEGWACVAALALLALALFINEMEW
jgi:hypothetical protein